MDKLQRSRGRKIRQGYKKNHGEPSCEGAMKMPCYEIHCISLDGLAEGVVGLVGERKRSPVLLTVNFGTSLSQLSMNI